MSWYVYLAWTVLERNLAILFNKYGEIKKTLLHHIGLEYNAYAWLK